MPAFGKKPVKPSFESFVLRRLSQRQVNRMTVLSRKGLEFQAWEFRDKIINARIRKFNEIAKENPAKARRLAVQLLEGIIPSTSLFTGSSFAQFLTLEKPMIKFACSFLEKNFGPETIPALDKVLKQIDSIRKTVEESGLEKKARIALLDDLALLISNARSEILGKISSARGEKTQL